jgi:O-antigen/teichoic acid export membrane protein
MSRKRNFIAALSSGYLALAANIVYSMVSIPLALRYLSLPEFGLWSIVVQISGYLALLDLGVGQSLSRLLIDKKDDIEGGEYGATLKAAWIVFAIQGTLVGIFGIFCGGPIASMMRIPLELTDTFASLFTWNCLALAIIFYTTPLSLSLWAHQRSDLSNLIAVICFVVNLLALWCGFHFGLRTFSLLLASAAGTAVSIPLTILSVARLKIYPSRGHWGKLTRGHFTEILIFSRDLVIISLGAQLISASQMILVGRLLGVDAVAIWNVSIKFFNMAQLVVFRLSDFAQAAFAEMVVRNEITEFRKQFARLTALTAVGGIFFGVLGAIGNQAFVRILSSGKISWEPTCDIVAGIYLAIICVTRCFTGTLGTIKQIGNYKYIALFEGILFIAGSVILAPKLRFTGVLLSSIIANLICGGAYGSFRIAVYFDRPISEIFFGWLKRPAVFALAFGALGAPIFWFGTNFHGITAFMIISALSGISGLILALFIGMPAEARTQLFGMVAKFVNRRISE